MKTTLRVLLGTGIASMAMGTIAPASHALSLGTYDFGTGAGNVTPSGVVPGVTFSDFSYTGSEPTNQPAGVTGKAFGARGFSNDAAINPVSAGNTDDGFFSFTITPDSGKTVTINGLNLALKPSGQSAPTNFLIRSSVDSFAADLFTSLVSPNVWTSFTPTFGPLVGTSPVTFRIYGFNTGTGNADNLDIDNVALQGSVAATAVPTPALLPGLVGMGLSLWRKKQKEGTMAEV